MQRLAEPGIPWQAYLRLAGVLLIGGCVGWTVVALVARGVRWALAG